MDNFKDEKNILNRIQKQHLYTKPFWVSSTHVFSIIYSKTNVNKIYVLVQKYDENCFFWEEKYSKFKAKEEYLCLYSDERFKHLPNFFEWRNSIINEELMHWILNNKINQF